MTPPLLYQAELKAARACRCACLCDADPSPVTFKVFHGTTGGSARPLQVDLQIAEASCVCKLSQCQTRPLGSGRTHCSCQGRLCWTDGTPCLLPRGSRGSILMSTAVASTGPSFRVKRNLVALFRLQAPQKLSATKRKLLNIRQKLHPILSSFPE